MTGRAGPRGRRLAGRCGLALVLFAAGCGGPDADVGAPPTGPQPSVDASAGGHNEWDVSKLPDPCRTITAAQAERIIGEPVQPGVRLQTWPPLCSIRIPGPPEEFLYVSDDAGPTGRADFARQRTDSQATREVAGIGDQAYWLPEFNALHVLGGDVHVVVKFAGAKTPEQAQEKALAIARITLPKATAPA